MKNSLSYVCKEGQFHGVEDFSINLNIKHVNGMTHFDLAMKLVKYTHGYNILHKLLTPHDREYIFL